MQTLTFGENSLKKAIFLEKGAHVCDRNGCHNNFEPENSTLFRHKIEKYQLQNWRICKEWRPNENNYRKRATKRKPEIALIKTLIFSLSLIQNRLFLSIFLPPCTLLTPHHLSFCWRFPVQNSSLHFHFLACQNLTRIMRGFSLKNHQNWTEHFSELFQVLNL